MKTIYALMQNGNENPIKKSFKRGELATQRDDLNKTSKGKPYYVCIWLGRFSLGELGNLTEIENETDSELTTELKLF